MIKYSHRQHTRLTFFISRQFEVILIIISIPNSRYPVKESILCEPVTNFDNILVRGSTDLLQDVELQSWRNELADPMEDGGLGLDGVPCGKARVNYIMEWLDYNS